MNYFVKPVVCDYGIYRLDDNGERKLIDICNSLSNAEMVAEILNSDDKHKVWSRPTGEWIPVSERLPEESLNSVIGWDTYRERCVFVQYIDGHFQITGRAESFNIVAWRPLPEPYKKGEEE